MSFVVASPAFGDRFPCRVLTLFGAQFLGPRLSAHALQFGCVHNVIRGYGTTESLFVQAPIDFVLARMYDLNMTIEERLEKLTERHESLTHSVELIALENRERDRRLVEIMEGVARLLHVAEIHEERISRLEGGR